MSRLLCFGVGILALMLVAARSYSADAPAAAPAAAAPAASAPAKPKAPEANGAHRRLVAGVMKVVDPAVQQDETFAWQDATELLAADPSFDWAKNVGFRRDIWYLQFAFKPIRYVWIDMPQASGKMQRKLVRYMVYSVTNPGQTLHPVQKEDGPLGREKEGTYEVQRVDKPIRFVPEFLWEGVDEKGKATIYPDRVIPLAVGPIRVREDASRSFLTTVDIAAKEIQPGETVWGVVTWEEIDPKIDKFAIYVQGLTNAYRWRDDPDKVKPGNPIGVGRRLYRKTLKINFWRAGDEYYEREDEVLYGYPGEVDYEWVYR